MFEFRFAAEAQYYYLFLLVILTVVLLIYTGWQKQKALQRFGNVELLSKLMRSVSTNRRRWKNALLIIALTLIIVALIRPQYSTKFEEVTQDLLERTVVFTRDMLAEAKEKGYEEFDDIILVGGATRMPQVAERIKKEFSISPKIFDPDEAVAKGPL